MNKIKELIEDRKGYILGSKYFITSDSLNLVVEEYGDKIHPREKTISFGLKKVTYHANLKQVLHHIMENDIYGLDLSNLQNVVEYINKLAFEFDKLQDVRSI